MTGVLPGSMLQTTTVEEDSATSFEIQVKAPQSVKLLLTDPPLAVPDNSMPYRVADQLSSGERWRWVLSLTTSVLIHAVAAGLLLMNWSDSNRDVASPPAAMVVDLDLIPASPPVQPSEVPPGPKQVEAAPKPQPVEHTKFDPPPQVDPKLKPDFVLPEKPQPQRTEKLPTIADAARQTTAPPTVEAPKVDKSAAPLEGRNDAPPSNAEQAWEGRLLARLERNKRYPSAAQSSGQEGTVFLRLVIDRRGRLIDASLAKSGGFALLDRETLDLAKRASPYPAPPDSIEGTTIVRVVPIEFYIKKRR